MDFSLLRADFGDCGGSKVKCSRIRVGGGAVLGSVPCVPGAPPVAGYPASDRPSGGVAARREVA